MSDEIRITTNTVIKAVAVFAIVALVGMYIGNFNTSSATPTGMAVKQAAVSTPVQASGDVQEVTLSWGKLNYNPEVIEVEQGKPVKIIADTARLQGCFRSFQIPELGVSKSFAETDNALEFTPDKAGTFTFSCSMGMGNGKLVVA